MTAKLVFVVGNSRSGTTLLAKCLGNHAAIFTCSELHFFEEMWDPPDAETWDRATCLTAAAELLSRQNEGYLASSRRPQNYLEAAEIAVSHLKFPAKPEELYAAILGGLGKAHDADIVIDQTPQNALFSEPLLRCFSEAKIIHIVRDPRDVLASQKRKWRLRWHGVSNLPWHETLRVFCNYSPILMSKLWATTVTSAVHFEGAERFHLVRYEDLVQEPRVSFLRVCEFLEIPFSPEVLEARQEASSHFGDADQGLGIHPGSVGKWRSTLTSSEVRICQYEAGTTMAHFGYSAAQLPASPLLRLWPFWYLTLIPQMIAILLLNAGRHRHILRSIKRRFFPDPGAGLGR